MGDQTVSVLYEPDACPDDRCMFHEMRHVHPIYTGGGPVIENMLWTGRLDPDQALALRDFTVQGDTLDEQVSWWVEEILFAPECTLVISHTPSGPQPLRIPAGTWVSFDGARFGLGRREGGKDA